jgi:hypothetical protein
MHKIYFFKSPTLGLDLLNNVPIGAHRLTVDVPDRVCTVERIKMSTKSGPEFPDIFPDIPGNPKNPGKCPDIPACLGESNSTEIKLAQM